MCVYIYIYIYANKINNMTENTQRHLSSKLRHNTACLLFLIIIAYYKFEQLQINNTWFQTFLKSPNNIFNKNLTLQPAENTNTPHLMTFNIKLATQLRNIDPLLRRSFFIPSNSWSVLHAAVVELFIFITLSTNIIIGRVLISTLL